MRNKFIYYSIAIIFILALTGCREDDQNDNVKLLDCSTKTRITLTAPPGPGSIWGLGINVIGKIHGQATILVTDDKSTSRLERISGDVDLSLGSEWHSNVCYVECIPDDVTSGTLKVYYKFESR